MGGYFSKVELQVFSYKKETFGGGRRETDGAENIISSGERRGVVADFYLIYFIFIYYIFLSFIYIVVKIIIAIAVSTSFCTLSLSAVNKSIV